MSITLRGLCAALILCATTSQAHAWWWFGKDKSYADTRYPIVLVGGIIAFDDIADVDAPLLPVCCQSKGVDETVSSIQESVQTDELVTVHLLVLTRTTYMPVTSDPLQNSKQ